MIPPTIHQPLPLNHWVRAHGGIKFLVFQTKQKPELSAGTKQGDGRPEGSHKGLTASGWLSRSYFLCLQCAHTLGVYELLTIVFWMNLDV